MTDSGVPVSVHDRAGTVSLMSTSTLPSRGGGQGTVYPSKPRAAVAITICTRPPAFGESHTYTILGHLKHRDTHERAWVGRGWMIVWDL
jgi:hypothetical protein